MANLKVELAEQIQLLTSNDAFKAFLRVLSSYKEDVFEKLVKTPVSSDAYEREMAMRQGQLLGIDTVYRIISDAAIVVKRESMRGENGRE